MTPEPMPQAPSMPAAAAAGHRAEHTLLGSPRRRVVASVPNLSPPYWALAERSLFGLLDEGWRKFSERYTRADGSLRYDGQLSSRDGADDSFSNRSCIGHAVRSRLLLPCRRVLEGF